MISTTQQTGTGTMQERLSTLAPNAVLKVELDERAYLFPATKQVSQLQILIYKPSRIRFEAVFGFNETKSPTELFELASDDAREFARKLVETVYRAQSSLMVSQGSSIAINVVANGYILQFGELMTPRELFLSTACIWRVCGAIARAADFVAPHAPH